MKKEMTIILKIKEGTRRRGRHSLEPKKAHSTGEFVIVFR